jgi:mannitol/fructose-specific phosphotransferase system IIA component (Ntr-type)
VRLASILDPSCIVLDVGRGSKRDVLARLAGPNTDHRTDLDAAAILDELERRERESSTAIADGIAIPHARPDSRDTVTASFGRSAQGIDFDSLDGKPTTLIMVLVSPSSNPPLHVAWLSHVARVLADGETRRRLLEASTTADVLAAIEDRERALEAESEGRSKAVR